MMDAYQSQLSAEQQAEQTRWNNAKALAKKSYTSLKALVIPGAAAAQEEVSRLRSTRPHANASANCVEDEVTADIDSLFPKRIEKLSETLIDNQRRGLRDAEYRSKSRWGNFKVSSREVQFEEDNWNDSPELKELMQSGAH